MAPRMTGSPRLLAVAPVRRPGGAEIVLVRILDGLSADGWQITLATPGPGPLAELADRHGHIVAELPVGGIGARRGARAIASFPRARRLAEAHDVVYLNGTVAARLLPAVAGAARTVLHVHDLVSRAPRFWQRADVVLAASEAVAARLPGLDAHVVGVGVEPRPQTVSPPWPPDPAGGPIIGYVGRLEPAKGVDDLVAAAPAIRAAHPGARIVIVGEPGFEAGAGEYASRIRASGEVECYGWVEGAAGLMSALDLLVLPSRQEAFATVLAEALAAGTPVVATRVGGLPELVREGVDGLLVEPGDPPALAEAVGTALERHAELAAGARESGPRFDAHALVRRIEPLIAPRAGSAA